jgi:hypothetical protein
MHQHELAATLQYERHGPSGPLSCELQVCADGSVYVTGDELEFILENAANALAEAIQRVESLGYKRCPMAAMSRPE